jgi:protein-arginine kinase activator protein McsA
MLAYFQSQGKQPVVVTSHTPQQPDKCPSCGITFAEIQQTGRMGCPYCYTHFKEQMDLACQGIHGSNQHCGKKPNLLIEKITADEAPQPQTPSKLDEHLALLEQRLGEAVRTEQFEECIRLRDVIRGLKSIKAEKAAVLAQLQVAAEAEDTDEVQRLSAKIAQLSKQFASLVMSV